MARIQIARVTGQAIPLIGLMLDGELSATMDHAFARLLIDALTDIIDDPVVIDRQSPGATCVEGNETRN